MQVAKLLDRAKTITGSDKATADLLGVRFQKISTWRHERESCPLAVQANLCALAGMTEGEQMRYVWEVVRARMGKNHAARSGAVASD